MRKRDFIAERTLLFLLPLYYWIGFEIGILPTIKEITEINITVWEQVSLVAWFILCIFSEAILRQGISLWDSNDNEEE